MKSLVPFILLAVGATTAFAQPKLSRISPQIGIFDPRSRELTAPANVKQKINSIRNEIRNKALHFEVGYTSAGEFPLQHITGYKPPANLRQRARTQNSRSASIALNSQALFIIGAPSYDQLSHFDWRELGVDTTIRDQGDCGSCYIFAALGAYEGSFRAITKREIDVAEQQPLDCPDLGGCEGGFPANVLAYLTDVRNSDEPNYPYQAAEGPCRNVNREFSALNWGYVSDDGEIPTVSQMKKSLCKYGPLAVAVSATDAFQFYTGGAFDENAPDVAVNHAVTLLGWDDTVTTAFGHGVWIIRNSWGQFWGETAGFGSHRGFMLIAYQSNNIGYSATWVKPKTGLHLRTKSSQGNGTWASLEGVPEDGPQVLRYPKLIGDVDGDGTSDIIFTCMDLSGPGLYIRAKRSNGDGTWTSWGQVLGDGRHVLDYQPLVGDVDGDGKSDVIFVGKDWSGPGLNIRVKRSNGDGTWTSWGQVLGDGRHVLDYRPLVGDVDGDGKSDVIFTCMDLSGPGLYIRAKRSNGDGTWTSWGQVLGDGQHVLDYSPLVGDVDGDGKTDVIFVGKDWSGPGLNIRVKRSNGDGTWTSWGQVLGDGPHVLDVSPVAAFVDRDGKIDVVFAGMNF
jgi:cathepsin L